jgi:hypothetical protein
MIQALEEKNGGKTRINTNNISAKKEVCQLHIQS